MSARIEAIENRLAPLRAQLKNHELYAALKTLDHVKTFTEYHVYAVWDFMSLLKALQQQFTCVRTPWVPAADPEIALHQRDRARRRKRPQRKGPAQ